MAKCIYCETDTKNSSPICSNCKDKLKLIRNIQKMLLKGIRPKKEQVVMCKECKHWGGVALGNICKKWSGLHLNNRTKFKDYCSYGEKESKTNEQC